MVNVEVRAYPQWNDLERLFHLRARASKIKDLLNKYLLHELIIHPIREYLGLEIFYWKKIPVQSIFLGKPGLCGILPNYNCVEVERTRTMYDYFPLCSIREEANYGLVGTYGAQGAKEYYEERLHSALVYKENFFYTLHGKQKQIVGLGFTFHESTQSIYRKNLCEKKEETKYTFPCDVIANSWGLLGNLVLVLEQDGSALYYTSVSGEKAITSCSFGKRMRCPWSSSGNLVCEENVAYICFPPRLYILQYVV